MADTGAPWNIPYAEASDLVRDWPDLSEDVALAVAAGLDGSAFSAVAVITATNASWPVPTLTSPIVKVTCIGGGGGGGTNDPGSSTNEAGTGGTTTFNAGSAGTVTAVGGAGGGNRITNFGGAGPDGTAGLASGNGAGARTTRGNTHPMSAYAGGGAGGAITVAYLDLTGISTVNVTIGAGGSGVTSGSGAAYDGRVGGRGEVIVEYKAG